MRLGRFRGAAFLTGGELTNQVATFLRNVVVARALTQHDYGVGATFRLALMAVEVLSDLSVARMVVQDPEGDEVRFQRTLQLMRLAQGLFVGALIYLTAPWIAALFNLPEAEPYYRALASIPIVDGLMHLDPQRFARHRRFGRRVAQQTLAEVSALVVVYTLSHWIQDYRLMFFGLLTIPVTRTVVSHLTAERYYGLAVERSIIRRAISFGWPLLLNGVLMVFLTRGDRLLLGSAETIHARLSATFSQLADAHVFGKDELALYSVAAILCFMPTMFFVRTLGAMLYPTLSRLQDDPPRFERLYRDAARVFGACGALVAGGFIVGGAELVELVYSERYAGVEAFIGWLGISQGLRMFRVCPATLALARADTKITLFGNLARGTSVIGSAVAVILGLDLRFVAISAVGGELVSLAATLWLVRVRHGVPAAAVMPALLAAVAIVALAFGLTTLTGGLPEIGVVAVAGLYVVAAGGVTTLLDPRIRAGLRQLIVTRQGATSPPQDPEAG